MKVAYKKNGKIYCLNTLDGSGIPEGVEKVIGEFLDPFYRQAWDIKDGKLMIDLQKAKNTVHEKRRALRELEFEPHDQKIAKQIPGWESAEKERVKIREKYQAIQIEIDSCQNLESLNNIVLK